MTGSRTIPYAAFDARFNPVATGEKLSGDGFQLVRLPNNGGELERDWLGVDPAAVVGAGVELTGVLRTG